MHAMLMLADLKKGRAGLAVLQGSIGIDFGLTEDIKHANKGQVPLFLAKRLVDCIYEPQEKGL